MEIWIEAGILGRGAATHALSGEAYNKAMRSHKLTPTALWRIVMPALLDFIKAIDADLHLTEKQLEDVEDLVQTLRTDREMSAEC